ncbi:hypothetical protein OIV83_001430 [Microbotryomycetes sp. JL201]|nr:hypothetical protein OIV83_001430 [Microbotryomycetes sp. JL201]
MSNKLSRRQHSSESAQSTGLARTYTDHSYPPAAVAAAASVPTLASSDAIMQHSAQFAGRDTSVPGGRYPAPTPPYDDDYSYEKAVNPVTRGSIAAQMAAEGQIPKKEGLRLWRMDEHKGTFTRGGRGRCCGRVCCCALILAVIVIVSIFAAFFLWVKPPSVSFNGIEASSIGDSVSVGSNGFNLNVKLNIGVINPNFFGATFSKVTATAYYPTKPSSAFGGGELEDVRIPKMSNNTIHFPFAVNYTTSYDSDGSVLQDIANKCGFTGSSASKIKINYKIALKMNVLSLKITPTFSSSASFDCPLSEDQIKSLLSSNGLSGLLNGRSLPAALELDRRSPQSLEAFHLLARRGLQELDEPLKWSWGS